MSLYNMLFGQNPLSDVLLATLDLDRAAVGRFRDCFIAEGEIAVYTRNGGGNRECGDRFKSEMGTDCGAVGCYSCIIESRLPKHPNYLRDKDDDFDCTYATVYFSFPERYKEFLSAVNGGKFEPDKRWLDYFEQMKSPDYQPPPALVAAMDKLKAFVEVGDDADDEIITI